jgi:sulfatase modifying factor 1
VLSARRRIVALALALSAVARCEAIGAEQSALLPAGSYTPFQKTTLAGAAERLTKPVAVAPFRLDVQPVTNDSFLEFVREHPKWRKSQVKPLFADAGYLRRWPGDLELPDAQAASEPVTDVSWFAARAYCRARGQRLATTEQWEYALADNGRGQAEVRIRSLDWFSRPNATRPGPVGASAPNGFGLQDMVALVWEWTLDFDAYSVSAESRDPNGKESTQFCGGAAAGVADPTDYPAFMRYSMRASLKADYTADNVGFRCAGDP